MLFLPKPNLVTLMNQYLLRRLFFFLIVIPFCFNGFSQSVWNSNSFKFTKDTASLVNMTGATAVTFNGNPSTSPAIPFRSFSFRYGLASYNSFYISDYAFIKLGSPISNNNPALDTSVIAALYNGTFWNASYKISGTAPDSKMVIEFSGVMQPSGEPTKFQIWLHERTGKIQLVYEKLRGYYGYSDFWKYRIFCKANILGENVIASVKTNPNNATPSVNYTTVSLNFDSIYVNTRFTFQPDTLKPTIPSALNFTNIQAGCLTANITENSSNESLVALERADSVTNFRMEKTFYVTAPLSSNTLPYLQTVLQPYWNYHYRTYASNGFLNSDTLYNKAQTLMPQLNGTKTVPGDYPTVSALLQDASCKHIGPNLVVELQNNYSFAAETLPLTFKSTLQNRFIQSIVIRPAANAAINWTANHAGPLFYVDSVKHVFLDGRPGGTGTTQGLTIYQQNKDFAAIQYTNAADSGGINYCRIIKKNGTSLSYAVVVVPYNSQYNNPKKDINAFSLTNNFISADSATVSDLVFVKPTDTLKARNFVISGNQFSRFRRSAIYIENGGHNLLISDNKFFQPISIRPEVYLPATSASCISLINTETVTVDNNYFGGESTTWGTGSFKIAQTGSSFSFIDYENTSMIKKAFIVNNKFGNISTGSGSSTKMIYAFKGDVLIQNNRFGTTDSVNSITNAQYFWLVDAVYGTKTLSNNFFSGIQGGYPGNTNTNHSYFITTSSTDSVAFLHNDVGGSNDDAANVSGGVVHGIYLGANNKNITIRGNEIRGFSSKVNTVTGISGANGLGGALCEKMEIDSNNIHHLISAGSVIGININVNSRLINRISYNKIYSLKTTGTAPGAYGPTGRCHGIRYSMYDLAVGPVNYIGGVRIFGNKIHSFESIRSLPNSIFTQYAISATSPGSKIYNNEIRLGVDSKGLPVDSLTSVNGIEITPVDHQTFLSDKHFIEHNTIYFGGKGFVGAAISAGYSYNYVSPNNRLTITNNIIDIERNKTGGYTSPTIYNDIQSIAVSSAKNLWYSSTIQNTQTLLQNFKQTCNCDVTSFSGDPIFINPAGDSSNYNLHLGPLSRAESTGSPSVINIPSDLDNKSRNAYSPVDIGCYASIPCGTGTLPILTLIPMEDSIQLCSGGSITLNASISGGIFQSLQWQKNIIDTIGAITSSLVINSPGAYRIIGKTTCGQVASSTVHVVSMVLQKSVSISSSADTICQGSPATFTAHPVNCGSNPVYQWKINGINAGTNSDILTTNTSSNQDTIMVTVTANVCSVSTTPISNGKVITVVSAAPPTILISTTSTNICAGTPVIFTTNVSNAGVSPVYQWQVNTVNTATNSANFTSNTLNNGDQIKCILTSTTTCGLLNTVSNVVVMTINTPVQPTIVIATGTPVICPGASVTFTATVTNGGNAPVYQWKVNGTNAGTNSPSFTSTTLNNNDQVRCSLTSNATCITTPGATSNSITITLSSTAVPSVNITATATNICSGAAVTFTASQSAGGSAPAYQWQVNGINAGTNSATFTSSNLNNNNTIRVTMTSNLSCASPVIATSNTINMTVITVPAANAGNNVAICSGSSVQLNGSGGANYSWSPSTGLSNSTINDPVASPSSTTLYYLTVTNGSCIGVDSVLVAVSLPVTPSVSISAHNNSICSGSNMIFNSTSLNAGATPSFQWQVNGTNRGSNSPTFATSSLQDGDKVTLLMTSKASCLTSPLATSNLITVQVTSLETPAITYNNNIITITNYDPAASYTWQVLSATQWISTSPAASGITFLVTQPGDYRVKADKGPCSFASATQLGTIITGPMIVGRPNPTQGTITVEGPAFEQWESLQIKNIHGQEMLPLKNIRNQTSATVNVQNLAKGMYYITLINGAGKSVSLKFIKH